MFSLVFLIVIRALNKNIKTIDTKEILIIISVTVKPLLFFNIFIRYSLLIL